MAPILPLETPSNVYNRSRVDRGDLEAGFAAADVHRREHLPDAAPAPGLPRAADCLVDIDADGSVHVWAGSKAPYGTRNALGAAVGMPAERPRLQPRVHRRRLRRQGHARNLPHRYFLAKATGRPVRMVADYLEEFLAGNPRHATESRCGPA